MVPVDDGRHKEALTVLTGLGIVFSVVLMAVFTVINLLGVGSLAKSNNVIMIWKIAIPFLAVIVLIAVAFNPSNFTAAGRLRPVRDHGHSERPRRRRHNLRLPGLRAGHPARRGDP